MQIFLFLFFKFIFSHEFSSHGDYGNITQEDFQRLIQQREAVRNNMNDQLSRRGETYPVPIIFHDIFRQSLTDTAAHSFCNYQGGFKNDAYYEVASNAECYQKVDKVLTILNEQFSDAGIQFYSPSHLLPIYPHTDPGFDSISTGIGGNVGSIRKRYFIPHVLNVFLTQCIWESEGECSIISGMSTYPWSIDVNTPGITLRHSSVPGMNDDPAKVHSIAILPHEIAHYFSLFHIEGIWMWNSEFTQELVSGEDCATRGDLICDTPGQSGFNDGTFFTELVEGKRECVYHGLGGSYSPETDILKLGGYNYLGSVETPENWCESWNVAHPLGLDEHCTQYTNYDEKGSFWGSKGLPDSCYNTFQNDVAAECPRGNFTELPLGHNFLQPVIVAQYCGARGFHEYHPENGFTPEQFANIRYSLEHDYTGCNNLDACNVDTSSTHLLRFGDSSCRYPCSLPGGCLKDEPQYHSDYSLYSCQGEKLNLENTTLIENFRLTGLYPNPFNPEVNIEFETMIASQIKVAIYNVRGQEISQLENRFLSSGKYVTSWNANGNNSGIYFLRISFGNHSISAKLIFLQ